MNRPFLFLSGEFRITIPLVFARENWQHSMSSKILELNTDSSFRRKGHDERLLGVMYHANVENEFLRRQNLSFLADNGIPCFPDPKKLLGYDDRHLAMGMVIDAGLNTNRVIQGEYGVAIDLPYPFVVKAGNEHQGQGKFLVSREEELPKWEGVATIEPFFTGTSCRVLWIEDKPFRLKFENPNSWIRNSAGAELSLFPEMPNEVIEHSRKVKDLFGLDVCGIDYIVNEQSGTWWFLEYNQWPGLDVSNDATPVVNDYLTRKMAWVEERSSKRALDELVRLSEEMGLYDGV